MDEIVCPGESPLVIKFSIFLILGLFFLFKSNDVILFPTSNILFGLKFAE